MTPDTPMLPRRPLPEPGRRFLAPTYTRQHVAALASALGGAGLDAIGRAPPAEAGCVLGWGLKPTALQARAFAARHGLPYWSVEDAFLRSVGLGKEGVASLSFALDDLGIYYDASAPSRLEAMIAAAAPLEVQRARAAAFRRFIVENRLSKYNVP
ncbi:MAG: capsular polysaccharide biosynthesis protein, partial [Proteobacteria bacterium]|nr:capsular polysaccharide biosynthesis protein [Pseudomonadota bacterium]